MSDLSLQPALCTYVLFYLFNRDGVVAGTGGGCDSNLDSNNDNSGGNS